MFFLSVLTYYFIEQPIRKNKMSFYKNLFLFYLIPLAVILGFYGFSKNKKDMIMADDFIYPTKICHDTLENNCIKGDASKPTKVLFVGDSYTGHLNAFVDIVGKKEGWSAMVTSGDGCTFVFNHEPLSYRSNYEFCKKRNEIIEKTYYNYSVIVLSNHWGDRQTIDDPKFIEKFKYTLDKLVKENKTVIVTNTSNTIRTSPYRQYVLANKNLNFGFASLEYEKTAQVREQTDVIKEIVKSKPQVMWVDVTSYIPESYFVDNKPVLADVSHLNNYGARYVAKRFIDDGRVLIHSKYLKESIK
ncbi:SGNH hydrolase domain-containing protein [Moraxella lacunata]